jgi:hypothetical protein
MVFTDTGPDGTLPALLRGELSARAPGEWQCLGFEAPPARNMPASVAALLDEHSPAAVLIAFSASYFTYDFVIARVRRRWPRAYPLFSRLTGGVKVASGGGWAGGDSLRGAIFKLPQAAAKAVIGAEPYIKLDHAIENARLALETAAGRPGLVIGCKLPTMNQDLSPEEYVRYKPRLSAFLDAILATCAQRGVFTYDIQQEMLAAGAQERRVDDGLHGDLATRTWEARFLAERFLERLGSARGSASAV